MKAVMIGVDPHKASHTAVAPDANERILGQVRVSSGPAQMAELMAWAKAVAQTHLGNRERRRARLLVGPTARRRRRTRRRCATQAGVFDRVHFGVGEHLQPGAVTAAAGNSLFVLSGRPSIT